jgi:regulator of sigma E protease
MALLNTLVAFVVALGCLIIVHELGHYAVARLCGVKVLRFSVGFGKPLWVHAAGTDRTEWVISAFPLGGYVKMLDEREGPVAPNEAGRAFNRQPVAQRFAIVAAGPIANFLLAIVLYWILFMHGIPGVKPVLDTPEKGTPAAVAGFARGDAIVEIAGEPAPTWQDARWILLQKAVQKDEVRIAVRTAAGASTVRSLNLSSLSADDLDADFMRSLGLVRFQPPLPAVLGNIVADSPAVRAGLQTGDVIVAIDRQPVMQWDEVVKIIRKHPAVALQLTVQRKDGTQRAISVTPDAVMENGEKIGRIGAGPQIDRAAMEQLMTEVRYGPVRSMGRAIYKTWDTSVFSLKMFGKMVVGEVSLKNLSGPITIADYAGQSAQHGWVAYCLFLALISISLGVLNLLPVPLLDGGHLMYYTFEVFKGSPVSDKAIEIGQQVGMALLVILMVFALYNDINRLISG